MSEQLTWQRWQPSTRPPRTLWVRCWTCRDSTLNEDGHLRGWQESTATPRVYRCAACSETTPTIAPKEEPRP